LPKIDLHLHTTASDGLLTPAQLVKMAAGIGMNIIAITDHDTVNGVLPALEAARVYPSLSVIPGVEINTDVPRAEVHMLGYFVDYENEELQENLSELRNSRETRAQQMVEKLDKLGIKIKYSRLVELADGGAIGRPHVAHALQEAGHVSSFEDAFERLIGRNCPAYVEHKKMTPLDVVRLITRSGGVPVMAHPDNIPGLENMIKELAAAGLKGMEIYYGDYTGETIQRLLGIARRNGLIATGGSDYHAFNNEKETRIGNVNVPAECARDLISLGLKSNPETASQYDVIDDRV
jgi:3',5'-nucleoside bisphosphate phosphatase